VYVTGFFTNDKYKALAFEMRKSVEAFGFPCVLYDLPDEGKWTANVNLKPKAILYALEAADGDSVLYLDADARMVQKPELIPASDYDVAVYYESKDRPCGGSMWFHSLERCGKLVETWAANVKSSPDSADDWQNFKAALDEHKPKILHLPPAYNYHKPTMRSRFPGAKPVIEHFCVGDHTYARY
jgi:hypothetical protein